jgi:sulfur-carrier protein
MKVNFYATLRQIVGIKTVEFELKDGMTVWDLVKDIVHAFPTLREELLDDEGHLYHRIHVLINGRDVPYLEDGINTVLKPDDTVNIFPSVGGG